MVTDSWQDGGSNPDEVAKQAASGMVTGRFTRPQGPGHDCLSIASRPLSSSQNEGSSADCPSNLSMESGGGITVTQGESSNNVDQPNADPSPAAVTFVTTEHFTLQGARSSTIAEATGRATMFLGTVSGGLIALGLIATAAGVGAAFYAFGLILLPTLAFVGLVTFDRVLQSGIEDHGYTRRIARLRGYYFQYAPELAGYLLSVPRAEQLRMQGLRGGAWQGFLTVAGMVGVVTAVLAGSAAGLLAAVASGRSLVAALVAGVPVAIVVLVWLMRYQLSAWEQVSTARLFPDE